MKRLIAILALIVACGSANAQHKEVTPTEEFTIEGAVENEQHLTIKDLLQFRQDTLKNIVFRDKVGKAKGAGRNMQGVLLRTLLDSAHVAAKDHKVLNELCILLTASDGYKNVYSWNEIFNTSVGDSVYIITQIENKPIQDMEDRILVMSLADKTSGRRHLKALEEIAIKRAK